MIPLVIVTAYIIKGLNISIFLHTNGKTYYVTPLVAKKTLIFYIVLFTE